MFCQSFDPPLLGDDKDVDGEGGGDDHNTELSEKAIIADSMLDHHERRTIKSVQKSIGRLKRMLAAEMQRRQEVQNSLAVALDLVRVLKHENELRTRVLENIKADRSETESALQQQLKETISSMTRMESQMKRCVTDSEVQVQLLRETVLQKTARLIEMEKKVTEAHDAVESAETRAVSLQKATVLAQARCAEQGLKILTLQKGLRDMEKVITEKETALLSSDDQNKSLALTVSSQADDIAELRGKTFKMEREAAAQTSAHKELVTRNKALEEQLRKANEDLEHQTVECQALERRVATLTASLDRANNRKVEDDSNHRLELQELTRSLHEETTKREELQHQLDCAQALNHELSKSAGAAVSGSAPLETEDAVAVESELNISLVPSRRNTNNSIVNSGMVKSNLPSLVHSQTSIPSESRS